MSKNIQPHNNKGQKHGLHIYYWANGNLFYKGNFINDEEDSPWIIYHDDGKLAYRGSYLNGEEIGYWEAYRIGDNVKRIWYRIS